MSLFYFCSESNAENNRNKKETTKSVYIEQVSKKKYMCFVHQNKLSSPVFRQIRFGKLYYILFYWNDMTRTFHNLKLLKQFLNLKTLKKSEHNAS